MGARGGGDWKGIPEEGMACGKTLRQERAWEFESKEVQCGWSTGSKGKRLGKESESTG